jgi:hypothetical protein
LRNDATAYPKKEPGLRKDDEDFRKNCDTTWPQRGLEKTTGCSLQSRHTRGGLPRSVLTNGLFHTEQWGGTVAFS